MNRVPSAENGVIAFPMQGELDETIINPDILPAVKAIRQAGVETIASNSGVDQIGLEDGWGSYIQIVALDEEVVEKIIKLTDGITEQMREELGNPGVGLQVVAAEKWFEDRQTTSRESRLPIFRVQLVGHTSNDEIRYAWNEVAARFALDEG